MSVNDMSGEGGVLYSTGGATVTPPGDKKIYAVGVIATAEFTSLKFTPPKVGNSVMSQVEIDDLTWFGVSLPVVGPTSFIPLGYDADELVYDSGDIILYLR